jgi:hypothetical protein
MSEDKFNGYRFPGLDIHSATIMQKSIELRKTDLTARKEFLKLPDRVFSAVIEELDQMYDDLDRHIGAQVRFMEYQKEADNLPDAR